MAKKINIRISCIEGSSLSVSLKPGQGPNDYFLLKWIVCNFNSDIMYTR